MGNGAGKKKRIALRDLARERVERSVVEGAPVVGGLSGSAALEVVVGAREEFDRELSGMRERWGGVPADEEFRDRYFGILGARGALREVERTLLLRATGPVNSGSVE